VPDFPLEHLRKRSEFLNVAKRGERWVTPAFIVQIYHRSSEGSFRYGMTASRKVGGAVKRNRAKRRLRVLLKQILPFMAHPGEDYVLIARKEVLSRNFALMMQELIRALKKLHQSRKI
jgi:ribonuclease P protein component